MEELKIMGEQWLHRGIEFVRLTENELFCVTLFVSLTIILFLFDHFFGGKKPSTVVFSGLSGSGKTVLFNRLRDVSSRQVAAVRSVELDQGTLLLHTKITMSGKPKPVQLVDIPGHPRFKSTLELFFPRAAAIVFVVDSLEFLRDCQAASEDLYSILTNASVVTNRIPLLLCCNKTDKVTAHTGDFISKQMERELERLRSSRNDFITLGIEGQVFSFSHCRNTVTVAETSGLTGETDQLQQFIRAFV